MSTNPTHSTIPTPEVSLRCHKLHGLIRDGEVLEVKCNSRFCGAEPGVVVLHHFDLVTGDLVKTLRFKEPRTTSERS
jgi:hypothetical protein